MTTFLTLLATWVAASFTVAAVWVLLCWLVPRWRRHA